MKPIHWIIGTALTTAGSFLFTVDIQGPAMQAFAMAIGFWIAGAGHYIADAIKENNRKP